MCSRPSIFLQINEIEISNFVLAFRTWYLSFCDKNMKYICCEEMFLVKQKKSHSYRIPLLERWSSRN